MDTKPKPDSTPMVVDVDGEKWLLIEGLIGNAPSIHLSPGSQKTQVNVVHLTKPEPAEIVKRLRAEGLLGTELQLA